MKGTIRILLGMLMVMGAVGGMEQETATLTQGAILAAIGLLIMGSGVSAANKQENEGGKF